MSQNVNNFAALSEQLIEKIGEFSTSFSEQIIILSELSRSQNQPSDIVNELYKIMAENLNQNKASHDLSIANQTLMENTANRVLIDFKAVTASMNQAFGSITGHLQTQIKAIEDSQTNSHKLLNQSMDLSNKQMLETMNQALEKITTVMDSQKASLTETLQHLTDTVGSSIDEQLRASETVERALENLDAKLRRAFEQIINNGIRLR